MKHILTLLLLAFISFNCERNAPDPVPLLPTVTTVPTSSVTANTALAGGNASAGKGPSISARGVCWGTATNPVITGNHTVDGSGAGIFASPITGLTANTTYYVRAYATNIVGTTYGNEITFTTTNSTTALPTVTTTAITAITMVTAAGGGNVTADGGATISARGVCWSVAANPTIALTTKTTDGTGTGIFTSAITGLTAATTYHVRAYATNSVGTSYGGDSTFTTASTSTIPTITTTAISAITNTTANSGGTISTDGGAAVTARGVCWSTTANPTVALSTKTTDGTGIGTFTSAITGLTANATYHVRAYATNSVGTAYGNDLSFTTTTTSTADVYIGGFEASGAGVKKAVVWKNGVPTYQPDVLFGTGFTDAEVNSVFVIGTDVYATGWEISPLNGNRLAMLWKNAVPTILSNQAFDAEAKSVYVSGTDVYVTGWMNDGTLIDAKLWKNGVMSTVASQPNGGAEGRSVFVSGSDVYVGGYTGDGTFSYFIPRIYKNGTATSVANPYSAWVLSVFVDGADVHAIGVGALNGAGTDRLFYWKNGVSTTLTNSIPYDFNGSVHVSSGNVYAAGDSYSGTRSIATSWKNGIMTQLSSGTDNYYAKGIFSYGTDVYVVGQREAVPHTIAKLWKNGIETSLTNGSTDASANTVFIK